MSFWTLIIYKEYQLIYQYRIFFSLPNIGISLSPNKNASVGLYWRLYDYCTRTDQLIIDMDRQNNVVHFKNSVNTTFVNLMFVDPVKEAWV